MHLSECLSDIQLIRLNWCENNYLVNALPNKDMFTVNYMMSACEEMIRNLMSPNRKST